MNPVLEALISSKQVSDPVWQTGPLGLALTKIESPSQSIYLSISICQKRAIIYGESITNEIIMQENIKLVKNNNLISTTIKT